MNKNYILLTYLLTYIGPNLRISFNTSYLWIGSKFSGNFMDWIGLDWVSKNERMSNSEAALHHHQHISLLIAVGRNHVHVTLIHNNHKIKYN